jgi:3D-(3,5/4)-trihydroxycyclohexane-1,2-dione acylhydrolase (decyclizing)
VEAENVRQRARLIARAGSLNQALVQGDFDKPIDVTVSEGVLLALLRQDVTKFLGVLGHGNTDIGEVLRLYEAEGALKFYQCRNEVAMAHAGTALAWIFGETPAVLTSIGPGALQAFAGSLAAASNGIGVYHLYGDETTHDEGYNMQQIPNRRQGQFGRLTEIMSGSYTLHTPAALRGAMRHGVETVFHPYRAGPFYLSLPINVQPKLIEGLLLESLPQRALAPAMAPVSAAFDTAIEKILSYGKIVIKAGGGTRHFPRQVRELAETTGATVVLSPGSTGVLPDAHPLNMHVGGSKGSISGNAAMESGELVIVIGSRAVCQADCSGTGFPNAREVININGDLADLAHYNRTTMLPGDIGAVIDILVERLGNRRRAPAIESVNKQWLAFCAERKAQWGRLKAERCADVQLDDPAWKRPVLTQPSAIYTSAKFADLIGAVKLFDAGDVQANGFQVVEDDEPFQSITETGASYMGFAASAVLAAGLADRSRPVVAFTGDGSFMMNPQILIDAVAHNVRGIVIIFDNRRMGAISSLQVAQYGPDFGTNDDVAVDYVTMANAVSGVKGFFGGYSTSELSKALEAARAHDGLSVVHVPVHWGEEPEAGMGSYGRWNVGPWVDEVERLYADQVI